MLHFCKRFRSFTKVLHFNETLLPCFIHVLEINLLPNPSRPFLHQTSLATVGLFRYLDTSIARNLRTSNRGSPVHRSKQWFPADLSEAIYILFRDLGNPNNLESGVVARLLQRQANVVLAQERFTEGVCHEIRRCGVADSE